MQLQVFVLSSATVAVRAELSRHFYMAFRLLEHRKIVSVTLNFKNPESGIY